MLAISLCFFVRPYPRLWGRVVARPSPVFFFFRQGALGWWLFLLCGGYSSSTPIVCTQYAHSVRSKMVAILLCFFVRLYSRLWGRVVARPSPIYFFVGARCSRLVAIPPRWWLFLPSFHCMRPECPRPALEGGCCSSPTLPLLAAPTMPSYAPPRWWLFPPLCLSFFSAPLPCLVGGVVARPYSFFFGARRSTLVAFHPRWWLFPLPPLLARSMPTPCARRWWLFLLGFSFISCFFFSGGRVVTLLLLWLLPRKALSA